MEKGKFIVLEGVDGSGKTEQFKILRKMLEKNGQKVQTFDFPQYGKPSSFFVEQYLNGNYGGWKEVGPYKASLFYALDRFDIALKIKQWLAEGFFVLSNRYVASNMGHQGAKISSEAERKKFIKWVHNLEFNILRIPKPDINFFLHVPSKIAYELTGRKGEREYLKGKKRDIHEADIKHLKAAEKSYLTAIKMFPNDFVKIECVKNGKLLTIQEISDLIWKEAVKLIAI